MRIVHGSPSAGNVDIYVAAPDTDINTINPTFANVPFKANTGYVGLAGDTYEVSVTPAGAKTPVAIFAELPIANGDIFTVIARDDTDGNGGPPLGLWWRTRPTDCAPPSPGPDAMTGDGGDAPARSTAPPRRGRYPP